MNILKMLFKAKDNIAWKSNKPTQFVVECFDKGIIKENYQVIDIGCGFGRNSNWLANQRVEVTAVNIDDNELATAKDEASKLGVSPKYINQNILTLDLDNKLFDVALDLGCSHMLSESDQLLFADKATALVKSGGYLIYFGFSKQHPAYDPNNPEPKYRDLDDLKAMYGKYFDILSSSEYSWKTKPEEHSKYPQHIGLNIVWRRK